MRINTFSVLPSVIRYSTISDFSKIVWTELYAENYAGNVQIRNKDLSLSLGKNEITISRAISELEKAGFIDVIHDGRIRTIAVKKLDELSGNCKVQYDPEKVKETFDAIDKWLFSESECHQIDIFGKEHKQ